MLAEWHVLGVGACRGASTAEVLATARAALAIAGVSADWIRQLATVEARADEPGLLAAAAAIGVPLVGHAALALRGVPVALPSSRIAALVGTPSVAEAAARYGGAGAPLGELVLPKLRSDRTPAAVTVALARHRAGVPPAPERTGG